ncbi:MAG TPA: ribosome maturation factor RimP, partial [Alphaproteobacteria bacterium]|nr:ribosome maturation factor RimP [Alphaproteobacteria bacterium]
MPALTDPFEELIAPQVEALGMAVVRVKVFGGRRQVLQVMIERADGSDVTVEECARVSRAISPILDVYDPLEGAYQLEVSSPGIDRPLTRPADFDRFAGFLAKVELAEPANGRRRFRGILLGLQNGDMVRLRTDDAELAFPLADLQSAKLVLTDELISAHQEDVPAETPAD